MNNFFEIDGDLGQSDGGIIRGEGQLLHFFKAFKAAKAACGYIYLVTDEGDTRHFETRLTSHNFDSARGNCYASYQISLDFHDLSNKNIVETGFAFDKDEASAVSSCKINYFKKESTRLIITGTIFLDDIAEGITTSPIFSGVKITGASFLGGENPLIRALLGIDAFDKDAFLLKGANLRAPLLPFDRGNDNIDSDLRFNLDLSDNRIMINSEACGNIFFEIVLFYKGVAVLRCLPLNPGIIIEQIGSSQNNQVVVDGSSVAIDHFVLPNGTRLFNHRVYQQPSRTTLIRQEDVFLGQNYRVISEPNRNYFAVFDRGNLNAEDAADEEEELDIKLFKFDGTKIIPFGAARGKNASLCIDGSLVVYKKSSIEIINFERQSNSHLVLDIKPGEKNETAFLNNSFAIAVQEDNVVTVYSVNRQGEIFNNRVHTYANNNLRLINFGDTISVVGTNNVINSYSPFGMGSPFDSWLGVTTVGNFIRSDNPVFESGRLVGTNFNTTSARRIEPFATSITANANARVFDDFLHLLQTGGGAVQPLANGASFRISNIFRDFGEVVRIFNNRGRMILFSSSGHVFVFVYESRHLRVVAPEINNGDFVTVARIILRRHEGAVRINFEQRG